MGLGTLTSVSTNKGKRAAPSPSELFLCMVTARVQTGRWGQGSLVSGDRLTTFPTPASAPEPPSTFPPQAPKLCLWSQQDPAGPGCVILNKCHPGDHASLRNYYKSLALARCAPWPGSPPPSLRRPVRHDYTHPQNALEDARI